EMSSINAGGHRALPDPTPSGVPGDVHGIDAARFARHRLKGVPDVPASVLGLVRPRAHPDPPRPPAPPRRRRTRARRPRPRRPRGGAGPPPPAPPPGGPPAPAGPAAPAAPTAGTAPPGGAEVLWDTWGVPHVFAADAPGLFFGFGWAQAHAHGDLLLRLYAQARGRGAEGYGEELLPWDRGIRTLGMHERGGVCYAAESGDFRANLDAFAAGVTAYAAEHPGRLAPPGAAVLPVAGADVLAHAARILFQFLGGASGVLDVLLGGSN